MTTIKTKQLLDALTDVSPGLENSEISTQGDCYLFQDSKVFTYNDEIAVARKLDLDDIDGVAVPARELQNFLRKCKDEEIEVKLDDGNFVLDGKNTELGLATQAPQMPLGEIAKPKGFNPVPDDFGDALKKCIRCTDQRSEFPVLECISIHKDMAIASNPTIGCAGRYWFEEDMAKCFPQPIIIPNLAAKHLIKYKIVAWSSSKGWLHFQTPDGLVFICRTINSEYPDLDDLFDQSGHDFELPKELPEALDRISVISDQGHLTLIDIKLEKNKIVASCQTENGWARERIKSEYGGPDLEFTVNAKLMADFSKQSNIAVLSDKTLSFQQDEFEYVVALRMKS